MPVNFLSDVDEPITLIGFFTVTFASAEAGLDLCNTILFKYCDGNLAEPKMPRTLKRKISFFRKCQSHCSVLQTEPGIVAMGTRLAEAFSNLQHDRHFLIHGIGSSLIENQKFTQFKFDHVRDSIRVAEKAMSTPSLRQLIKSCLTLSEDTLVYCFCLFRFIPADKLDEIVREHGVELARIFGDFPKG